ncbi:hypothetical protein LH128_01819 [Sphingomonas sp. LH128]|uniref:hypothetical protein n=1 Tax=Sphingomonas sp. LH128 TaxID=473781 RepID=UPI00027C96C5|nr:hypothetical protein [Sphingomonas sp. LH128]EJU14801.1 hypothetical protein LH128_01819 [Sphingomonas sp. LH128]
MTPNAFDENVRRQIRTKMIQNGVAADRADQAVDLGCHAATKAVDTLLGVVRAAPDTGIGMMSIELALQLATARMAAILERAHSLGGAGGVHRWGIEVELAL